MAQQWMLDWELCDFKGIRTSIAKKPYIFVIFQGGGGAEVQTPSGSAHDGATIDDEVRESGSTFIAIIIMLKGVCEQAEHVSRHKNTWICIWKWNTATSRWILEPIKKHIGVHTKALNGVNIRKT